MTLEKDFRPSVETLKSKFIEWYNNYVADFDVEELSEDEVYVVWFCYIVGNAKALISTTRPDHMYYEVTYHSELGNVYVDMYTKIKHDEISEE